MSVRKAVTTVVLGLACAVALTPAQATAGQHDKTRITVGKSWGTVTVNVETLEFGGTVTAVMSHIGKLDCKAYPTETVVRDGMTHSRGTFVWTHASGSTLTGTYTSEGGTAYRGLPHGRVGADDHRRHRPLRRRERQGVGALQAHAVQGPPVIAESLEGTSVGYVRF